MEGWDMNSKNLVLLACVTITSLAAQSAAAADLPPRPVYREAVQVAAPVANWTGWYVGLGGGYGMYDARSTTAATTLPGFGGPFSSNNGTVGGKGYFGRAQIGYDYQFGSWVAGVFGDYDISSIKGTLNDALTPGVIPFKQTSAWAAGGRLGYLVTPQLLTFFDGGYAHSRFVGGAETFAFGCPTCRTGASGLTLANQNFTGYFLGGGTEYMIFPGWFVKSEYRLASYSSKAIATVLGPPTTTVAGITTANITTKPTVQTITAELVYKFNWGQ
jgi:outer membrane immunogenic protein